MENVSENFGSFNNDKDFADFSKKPSLNFSNDNRSANEIKVKVKKKKVF